MKRTLMALAFGAVLAAQSYGGRPGNGPSDNRSFPTERMVNVNRQVSNFAERIARGERMGQLTRREASRLWAMDRELRFEMERASRSGFGVSHAERNRLAAMSLRLDRAISAEMRDGDRSFRSGPGRW
jgi:hypothetical protein